VNDTKSKVLPETKSNDTFHYIIDTFTTETKNHNISTAPARKEISKEDEAYYKRAAKVKSYPDFLKNYFKEGSDEAAVTRLQGIPDVKDDLGQNRVTWFYGDCEVEFYNGKVKNVVNGNGCLKFIPGYILLTSDDSKLREIAKRLMDNEAKDNKSRRICLKQELF